ncbi:hypothetical protein VZ94_19780 [Methylocucumis oryzae]|uniref:Uncharacterized protein n=2 Tax=Methylocucumis oryzae TaxID=1632867 RepID=A0A0F3IID3_9GAMM|nr:hypothetical protein VZ94_19780 [Methylocucumis oryzae]
MTTEDTYLLLLMDIEADLVTEYERNPNLTDTQCIFGLENAKVAVKQRFGFGKSETIKRNPEIDNIINGCVQVANKYFGKIDGITLKDFITQIDKIMRSVRRHSEHGHRAYYQFVKDYVKNKNLY